MDAEQADQVAYAHPWVATIMLTFKVCGKGRGRGGVCARPIGAKLFFFFFSRTRSCFVAGSVWRERAVLARPWRRPAR